MSDLNLKQPVYASLNSFTESRISSNNQLQGKSFPCVVTAINQGFVTVSFLITDPVFTLPQVTVPIAMSQYVRLPIQVGDKGICIASDVRLGGVTGQNNFGSEQVTLNSPANLSALVFVPLTSVAWQSVNQNQLVLYGPDGVVIRDFNNNVTITVNSSGITINGNITLTGNMTIQGTLTVDGQINTTGDVIAHSNAIAPSSPVSLENHVHGGVQGGTSFTTPPTTP
jgi:hypothetical protein